MAAALASSAFRLLTTPLLTVCLWTLIPALSAQAAPAQLRYTVIAEHTHDNQLFTQGLLVQDDALVESSGGYGQSLLRRYDAVSGAIEKQIRLPDRVFAEGIAQVQDELLLLTWRAGVVFRLNAQTLQPIGNKRYEGEGWGLTFDGKQLIMSDGSDALTFRDPQSFAVLRKLRVHSGGVYRDKLNELEYADGHIWANVWQEDHILRISAFNGEVTGILDLSQLAQQNNRIPGHSVLNGIAYDKSQDAFWVTGKLWPQRYLIKIYETVEEQTPAPTPKASEQESD